MVYIIKVKQVYLYKINLKAELFEENYTAELLEDEIRKIRKVNY